MSKINIVFDNREPALYSHCCALSAQFPEISCSVAPLDLGDIVFRTESGSELSVIERKSLADLVASIKDGRYEEQSYRLTHTVHLPKHHILYIVEGMLSQLRTHIDKKLVLGAMTSLQFFKGFSVIRTCSVAETGDLIMTMASKLAKDLAKGRVFAHSILQPDSINAIALENSAQSTSINPEHVPTVLTEPAPGYSSVVKKTKKENLTPENMGEILLSQIPGISSVIAVELMKTFGSIRGILDALQQSPEQIETFSIVSGEKRRRLGKNVVENLKRFLLYLP